MSQGHLQGQISKIPILTDKGTCVISLFHGILSEKSIYGNILLIQGNLQGQEVISKVKDKMAVRYFKVKYDFSTNEARNKCNTLFSCDFDWEIHFFYYFYDSRSCPFTRFFLIRSVPQETFI